MTQNWVKDRWKVWYVAQTEKMREAPLSNSVSVRNLSPRSWTTLKLKGVYNLGQNKMEQQTPPFSHPWFRKGGGGGEEGGVQISHPLLALRFNHFLEDCNRRLKEVYARDLNSYPRGANRGKKRLDTSEVCTWPLMFAINICLCTNPQWL